MKNTFLFPTIGIKSNQAILLAIDDMLMPLKKNLCFYMSKPKVRTKPVLAPSSGAQSPDNVATHFYGTVIYDVDKFRMWYYSVSRLDGGGLREGPICYAESADGLYWVKPDLGQFEFNGRKHNNALSISEKFTEGVFVLKDEDEKDSARRYKMVFEELPLVKEGDKQGNYSVSMAISPDGINWTICDRQPIDEGLEPCSLYKFNNLYIINAQFAPSGFSEGGYKAGRQGHAWVSPDFKNWLGESVSSFTLPENENPNERGLDKAYLQVHLGTAAKDYGNVMVGLYCRWHAKSTQDDWFGRAKTFGDFGIVLSNDGLHFREPVKEHVYLSGKENPVTPHKSGKQLTTILCQANGILNVGDETRIYHGRWRNGNTNNDEYYGEVGLVTLPRDRWGALGLYPGKDKGSVCSAPIKLPENGCAITLNADGAEMMKIEITDENFVVIEDFSGKNCGTAKGSGLDCKVSFKNNLSELGGKTVRLRIYFQKENTQVDPRLYAINLVAD